MNNNLSQEMYIILPREMDEDLWYLVGGALGAESPEQCARAAQLWNKLVKRADADKARSLNRAPDRASRTEFETWAKSQLEDEFDHPIDLTRADQFEQGDKLTYCERNTRKLWAAWQASKSKY